MRSLIVALVALVLFVPASQAAPTPVECGDVITTDTTMANDLSCSHEYPAALTIGAPGITLDLGGHKITSSNEGIRNDGHDAVTIRNGKLLTELGGVQLAGVTGNVVRDLDFSGLFEGVTLRNSDENRIIGNLTISNQIALLDGSDRNVVTRNTVTAYESYIRVTDSSENRIVNNIVWSQEFVTFRLTRAHGNVVRDNAFVTDANRVLSVVASNANEMVDNMIVQQPARYPIPGPGAVLLDGSNRNLLARNSISGAPLGVWVRSGNANVLRRNTADGVVVPGFGTFDQQPDGFFVAQAAQRTVVDGNTASGFEDDGFGLYGSQTEVGRNTATDNGRLGIEADPPAIDRGGNRASGNNSGGTQCVGVVCQ